MRNMKFLAVGLLLIGVVCVVGCKKDEGYRKVSGVVTMDGSPVDGATIMFYNQTPDGEAGGGKTGADGSYTVTSNRASEGGTGLKPGEYKVTIAKYAESVDPDEEAYKNGEITYDELQERKSEGGAYATSKPAELLTPAQYSLPSDTPLTVTVTNDPKQNVFDFTLE